MVSHTIQLQAMSIETPDPHGHSTEVAENVNLSANEKGVDGGHNKQPSSSAPAPNLLDDETIERLGRQRPPHFSNIWTELAFCFSIFMCQILSVWFAPVLSVLRCALRGLSLTDAGILHLWL